MIVYDVLNVMHRGVVMDMSVFRIMVMLVLMMMVVLVLMMMLMDIFTFFLLFFQPEMLFVSLFPVFQETSSSISP